MTQVCSYEAGNRPQELPRSVLSNGVLLLAVLAVQVGAAPGDVAALTSTNVVFAAVLGHFFLSEPLLRAHMAAVMLSLLGAVLVARPALIFGQSTGSQSWIGNMVAIAAGICQACIFICARKSAEVSGLFASVLEALVGCGLFLLLPVVMSLRLSPLDSVVASPLLATGYVAALFFFTTAGIVTGCTGAQMCPAAAGATVLTVSTTVSGYTAQLVLFGMTPSIMSTVGAALMVTAVVALGAVKVDRVDAEEPFPPSAIEHHSVDESIYSAVAPTPPTSGVAVATSACHSRAQACTRPGPPPQLVGCLTRAASTCCSVQDNST